MKESEMIKKKKGEMISQWDIKISFLRNSNDTYIYINDLHFFIILN